MVRAVLLVLGVLLSSVSFAQELSVGKLVGPDGQGSSVIVHRIRPENGGYLALAATARHCLLDKTNTFINRNGDFAIHHQNGMVSNRVGYAFDDAAHDLALVWLICPNDIPVAELAKTSEILTVINERYTTTNLSAEFVGYGSGTLRQIPGRPSFRHDGLIQSDAVLIPGQSGGGMFVGGKLVGIICGGNRWYGGADEQKVTWPARCADAELIPALVQRALTALK